MPVHAIWAGGRAGFWAEGSPCPATSEHHPFAGPPEELDGRPEEVVLRLPSDADGPVHSSFTTATHLREWSLPVVFPGDLPELEEPSGSVRFLAALDDFARDLVRRGRVLPGLVGREARWRPVLTGADAGRAAELAAAMPPVFRAADARPAREVLHDALARLADRAVRRSLPDRILMGHRPGKRSPIADQWAVKLIGDDVHLDGDLGELRAELDRWHDAAHAFDGPVRVAFRLGETGDDDWEVGFSLQSADDPSLDLPAAEVWRGARLPGVVAEHELLAGLGRAVRLYPELDRALRDPRPEGLALDTRGAFAFLKNAAPLLGAAGFGVRLPAWAGKTKLGLKLTTRTRQGPKAVGGQGFGLDQIVDFRVDLAVGEQVISEEELAELARLKVPLVRVRGQWVELDDRQLKAALKILEQRRDGSRTAREVINEVVLGGDDDLPITAVDADGLLGDLLSGEADRRLEPVPAPKGLTGTLRPYQQRGLAWLSFLSGLGLGGVLADDMGLGKTITTLSLLLSEREASHGRPEAGRGSRLESASGKPSRVPAPTLLVCPMSLLSNWQKEAARFAPGLRVHVYHGSGRELADADLVLTTYGTALRDIGHLAAHPWERVVCDEAQAIKNSAARQAQAVRSIPARTKLALTGTPVENHLAELWSIMEFCNPGLLGSARAFRDRFQEPIEVRRDENAVAALKRATGPFVLRRLKTDKTIISDLPDKLEMKVWCTLTPEQATLYRAVVDDMMGRIEGSEGIERRGNVLAAMTRLKQVCNHPAHLLKDGSRLPGRSGKLARLEELCEEILAEGEKALVFTQYAEFGSLILPHLSARLDRPVLWLHGGLAKKRRDELVDRFQADDEPMIFLLSLKAAGTGLNLTAANHVIHVDRWWNPAVENQATDRAFRIGQTKNVQVRKFICTGTIEERVDEMIERKQALAESVVGTGEDWITSLSTEQLRDLFTLGPEAVA